MGELMGTIYIYIPGMLHDSHDSRGLDDLFPLHFRAPNVVRSISFFSSCQVHSETRWHGGRRPVKCFLLDPRSVFIPS